MKLDLRIAKFIKERVYVDGKKLDLNSYAAFELPYAMNENKTLLMAGRQVGKTIYLATKLAVKSLICHPSRALYVSPLESQAKSFSKTKLQSVIDSTPELKTIFTGKGSQSDVFFKKNILGDFMELTYTSLGSDDPVRVRGKSAHDLYIDEAQDIDYDILPAIQEVTTASEDPIITYAGTAKSLENTTGVIWEKSNKMERIVKCGHCGHYNILGRENVSKKGLICSRLKCGKSISVEGAEWVVTGDPEAYYKAFRIPQICLPYHNTEKKWAEIWHKYVEYPELQFSQEVLGSPNGTSDRFLNIDIMKAFCTGGKMMHSPSLEWRKNYINLFMGIDWTGNGALVKSRTVALIIGHRRDGKFEIVWGRIIPPGRIQDQADELSNIAKSFQCSMVGADAGMGMIQNAQMMQSLGTNRFRAINYVSSSTPFKFDGISNTITLSKTQAVDTIMSIFIKKFKPNKLTGGRTLEIILPDFEEFKPFIEDILAEFTEETRRGTKIWTHNPMKPDDTLHALVFGMYAYMHYREAVTFY